MQLFPSDLRLLNHMTDDIHDELWHIRPEEAVRTTSDAIIIHVFHARLSHT